MNTITNTIKCNGCHACAVICPRNCIKMRKDVNGFLYPEIDNTLCSDCGYCKKVCPINSNKILLETNPIAYSAMIQDEEIRLQSSSGGMFTAIAEKIIREGGVVFGAAFNENFDVEHRYVESIEELKIFRGSKYVQSTIGATYKKAEAFLKDGRMVLFTGTPCQIGGLYSFLNKEYENLITQDIICHGVPSPMAWQKYLEYMQASVEDAKVQNVLFRSKKQGWKKFTLSILFNNNIEHCQTIDKNPWMRAFLKNLILRESCYDCVYKTMDRKADITLADLWGVNNICPEMDDDKGTSLIILHSSKGKMLFREIEDSIKYKEIDLEKAVSFNTAMISSVERPQKRDEFLLATREKGFKYAEKKFLRDSFGVKLKRLLLKVKNKMKKGAKNESVYK